MRVFLFLHVPKCPPIALPAVYAPVYPFGKNITLPGMQVAQLFPEAALQRTRFPPPETQPRCGAPA